MKKHTIKTCLIFAFITALLPKLHAQDVPEKTITVGSHVLKQDGNDEYAWNNGPFHYEKVWEVAGAGKTEIYNRVKKWVLSNLKAGDQNQFDDKEMNEIHTATAIVIPEAIGANNNMSINFKLNFYFKEGKYRLEATNFMYQGIYNSMPPALKNGAFNNLKELKAFTKNQAKKLYLSFDEKYLVMIRSLKAAVAQDSNSNW